MVCPIRSLIGNFARVKKIVSFFPPLQFVHRFVGVTERPLKRAELRFPKYNLAVVEQRGKRLKKCGSKQQKDLD